MSKYQPNTVMRAAKESMRKNSQFLPAFSAFCDLVEAIEQDNARRKAYLLTEPFREPTEDDRKALKEFLDGAKALGKKKAMP